MAVYKIPLTNYPQKIRIDLGLKEYEIKTKWNNTPDAGWQIDISDSSGVILAASLPLITGINLLKGLDYLGISGELHVFTDGDENEVPTFENLGTESNLYFVTAD